MKLPVLLGLCGSLVAQVPHGDAILSVFNGVAPIAGLALVKRSPATITPVTGLAATARANTDINSIQLDPCDNRVWIGGINLSAARIDTFTLNGAAVANFLAVGTTGNASSVAGIAFDANGNAVCASGVINTTGGVFRVNRKTNAVTRIVGGPTWGGQPGTCNCICSDDVGNLYFGVTGGSATVYQLSPGANGDYAGTALSVGIISPPSSSNIISSIEWAPATSNRPQRLWWTAFSTGGTAVGHLVSGVATAVGTLGDDSAPNWIDYDALTDDQFWVLTAGIDPDNVLSLDHAGVDTLIAPLPPNGFNGSPSAIDANDTPPTRLTVLPQYVSGAAIDIEACTTCPPGDVGGILLVSPAVVLLTTGLAGPNGRVFVKFPNLTVLRGQPNTLTLQAVCFNTTTAVITSGPLVTWPRN